jgi:hypothetical protein
MSDSDDVGSESGHPFACFGDSSSSGGTGSGGDDDVSDDDDYRDAGPPVDDSAASGRVLRLRRAAADLAESRRLRERSNADRPPCSRGGRGGVAVVPVTDDSRFEVFDTGPRSGLGLRATVAYARGDEVLRESAAMGVPNSHRASSLEDAGIMHRLAVQRAYDSMRAETRSAFMDLSSSRELGGGGKTPAGIYDTNAFRLGGADRSGGLFLTMSRMNHSCRPNVNHHWSEGLRMALVFAARDIAAGEELRTTYGPSEWMGTGGRREFLSERFAFVCDCEMCLEGNDHGGDDRMDAIRSLHERIALSSSIVEGGARAARSPAYGVDPASAAAAALEAVDRCLALMNEQGIGGGAFTKSIYHRGYAICEAAGDDARARSYLVSELRAVRDSEGADSPNATEIEFVLNRGGVCRAG